MKKLVIVLSLLVILVCALSCTAVCFAEDVEASEEVVIEEAIQEQDFWASVGEFWARFKEVIGISITTIVSAILVVVVRYIVNKALEKMDKTHNPKQMQSNIIDGVLDGMGNSVLNVNMQPLMEYQYREMSEQVYADLKKENALLKKMVYSNIDCLEKLGGYFDCSVAVSDEAKQAFKDAIAQSKALFDEPTTEITATIEVVAEAPKEATKKVAQNY